MDGVIPLFKEKGMTSADCVYHLRKILHERRIGHTGTLDPEVDGVLPICVGQATKLVNRLLTGGKIYQGEVTLGYATTTEDATGDEIARQFIATPPSDHDVDQALQAMTGDINQVPPMFSAVKINGKRLYEYARAGETIERPSRQIHVDFFTRTSPITYDPNTGEVRFRFEVGCSKGTYVRTLATDLGVKLGYPSVMSDLRRLKSGGIELAQTVTLAEVEAAMASDQLVTVLRPIEQVLANLPQQLLNETQWQRVKNGGALQLERQEPEVALVFNDKIKAIYQYRVTSLGNYVAETMLLGNE
ncbi:tRNA pseudouridine synthase B [Lapidilactobacillus concavus DSM 17758]|uniref:tRNA pseudouridine synthase B n=1 Tax=Lapidilactobacillus concavus DSM 17758 TaxID=1423735 RepID=A0A0R1VTG6_9LACO|nr:tRNA pseudouridine(55) synthase TruB [Lapidilactobacillus concavus]KRM08709.1 tRNA pseudouridine synthase B [Lapidilactobacillus concavus DSM 17758]GEL14097.1 tRNA pseudouridine synthase B [Lapidilactobacillus concavus]